MGTSVQVNQIIQTFLRDKEKMNEIMFNNSLNVRRKISAGGANQGAFLPQDCANGVNNGRRASEGNYFIRNIRPRLHEFLIP